MQISNLLILSSFPCFFFFSLIFRSTSLTIVFYCLESILFLLNWQIFSSAAAVILAWVFIANLYLLNYNVTSLLA